MGNQVYQLTAEGIGKRFGEVVLFRNIHFSLVTGQSMAITGPNGSGKSTLLSITAKLTTPDRGKVVYLRDQKKIDSREIFSHMGMVSPAIMPYRELTALENIRFALNTHTPSEDHIHDMMEVLGLYPHRSKPVAQYSTGMLQRLKLLIATLGEPGILFLDEPGSNLDTTGKDIIYTYLDRVRPDIILCIATNESSEAGLCERSIYLGTDHS
ncbi:MAG: ABC transporter ATP-binding protein [Spirochaetota bacterium]